jgi:hypothetical protein
MFVVGLETQADRDVAAQYRFHNHRNLGDLAPNVERIDASSTVVVGGQTMATKLSVPEGSAEWRGNAELGPRPHLRHDTATSPSGAPLYATRSRTP